MRHDTCYADAMITLFRFRPATLALPLTPMLLIIFAGD